MHVARLFPLTAFAIAALVAGCTPQKGEGVQSASAVGAERASQDDAAGTANRGDMIPGGEFQGGPQRATLPAGAPTRVLSAAKAETLRNNSGITLQWIGWERRGEAEVTVDANGTYYLVASQRAMDASGGMLKVSGVITEIGNDYFLLDGPITIGDTPDAGRQCSKSKVWRFEITQDREYWRLREFEWCDRLTDYIDIYF